MPVLAQVPLAQAAQVPVLARAQPAERPLVPVPVWARVQALAQARVQALAQARVQALAWVPGLASARAPVRVPGFQPLALRPWGLRPCAHT